MILRAKWGNLGTQCCAVQYVTADGSLVDYSRDDSPETFEGAVCSLGCLVSRSSLSGPFVDAALSDRLCTGSHGDHHAAARAGLQCSAAHV